MYEKSLKSAFTIELIPTCRDHRHVCCTDNLLLAKVCLQLIVFSLYHENNLLVTHECKLAESYNFVDKFSMSIYK